MTEAAVRAAALPATADLHRLIADSAAALDLPLDRDQTTRLTSFVALLSRWNRTYNLTAVREPAAMVSHHIADCLAAVAPLRRALADGRRRRVGQTRLLDVGSGGGLPGVVLAIAEPGWVVTCVDSVGKKAAFVTQAAAELRLQNLRVVHARVESLSAPPDHAAIVSRAFGTLGDLVDATRHLLAPGGFWLAMKGHEPRAEMADLAVDATVFHVEQIKVPNLQAARRLIFIESKQ